MAILWYILLMSMLSASLTFDMIENVDSYRYQIEYGEPSATSRVVFIYNYYDEQRGSRFIRAAATKKPSKASKKSGGAKNNKNIKLNKITQKYWRELLDCCEPPEFLTRLSRTQCYPKYSNFKGQVTVGPLRLPNSEPFNRTCLVQCAFQKEGLIDKTTKLLSITGIDTKIKTLMTQNPKWSTAIQRSYDSCNAQYTSLINTELTCNSGAAEWAQCLVKFMVANCPDTEKKTKITGCFEKLATVRAQLKVKAAPQTTPPPTTAANVSDTAANVSDTAATTAATTAAAASSAAP